MNETRNRTAVLSLLVGVFTCALGDVAAADSLHAVVHKNSYLPDEPLVIEVTLHLDQPVVVDFVEKPQEAEKQLRRLRRHLHVELRDQEGATVAKSFLFGVEFLRPKASCKEFSTGALAFWAMPMERHKEVPILVPNSYVVAVLDKGHRLESNEAPLEILSPGRKEQEAGKLFRQTLPEGALVILEQKNIATAMSCFEELARDYPETIYGKYAVASLALMRYRETFAEHNNKGGAAVWGSVARELAMVEGLFAEKHPLREKVLYDSVSAYVLSGDYTGARQSLAALKSTFPHGKLGSKSEEFEKGITRLEKQKRSAESDEE